MTKYSVLLVELLQQAQNVEMFLNGLISPNHPTIVECISIQTANTESIDVYKNLASIHPIPKWKLLF